MTSHKDNNRNTSSTKQSDTGALENHLKKLIELEKGCNFPDFSTKLFTSKLTTLFTDEKSKNKWSKEKDLTVWKIVEKQQSRNAGENKKNTILTALI